MSERAGERRRTAEEKVESTQDSLEQVEQEILDEVAEIDAEWDAKARELETIELRLESSDVRIAQLALVWVPTA
ncbi:MAG: hypothetical protein H0V45_13575 [Actinobacteria bacterium]|nr:hypothetical protein [Actinomycetota bacterium]